MPPALAIFVKTPGLSPIKTRLAASIGQARAEEFFRLSCRIVANAARCARELRGGDLQIYWAVAESEALTHPDWKDFPTIHQGDGDLGERLDLVYTSLLARHSSVTIIGADAPQILGQDICDAIAWNVSDHGFVFGPATDGGFWSVTGSLSVPRSIWIETPWSTSSTLSALEVRIVNLGKTVVRLRELCDVDTMEDLARLKSAMDGIDMLAAQRMKNFLDQIE